MDLNQYIETQMNHHAGRIAGGGSSVDERALGAMGFLAALRRVLEGNANSEEIGRIGAINDLLQERGVVAQGKTFYRG